MISLNPVGESNGIVSLGQSLTEALVRKENSAKNLRDRTYSIENHPTEDDFEAVLLQANCLDRGDFRSRWVKTSTTVFARYPRYEHYGFAYIDSDKKVPWEDARSLFTWGHIPHATVREMLFVFVSNKAHFTTLLQKGHRIISIGCDEFNLFRSGTALRLEGGALILESLEQREFHRKDLLLVREKAHS